MCSLPKKIGIIGVTCAVSFVLCSNGFQNLAIGAVGTILPGIVALVCVQLAD